MNDPSFEARIAAMLQARARAARPQPDLDAVRSGARTIIPIASSTRRPRSRLAIAAAVVALVAGGVTARVLANRSNPTVIAASSPTFMSTCIVFLEPTANTAQIDDVGSQLRSRPRTYDLRYFSQDDAYAEFKTLFADKPELVATLTAEILPSSWRYDTPDDVDAAQAELRVTLDAPTIREIRCNAYGQPLETTSELGTSPPSSSSPVSTVVSGSPASR